MRKVLAMTTEREAAVLINLKEQERTEVLLRPEEATLLRETFRFEVLPCSPAQQTDVPIANGRSPYTVNPWQYVGHFILAGGTTVNIRPKIPAANVFRMLAYVYASWSGQLFEEADVVYTHDEFLFEPMVQMFNQLVAKRARRGLVQDYIHNQDNLRVLKGVVKFSPHLRNNVPAHPDRLFCGFYENTCDVEDNQIIKWTLRALSGFSSIWSDHTLRTLRANFHQFEAVSPNRPDRSAFERRHYHRLNEDYRLIHSLCRLFLDASSISETPGEIPFRGFRLDMNELFERFVTEAFRRAARGTSFSILAQKAFSLSEQSSDFSVTIIPDVTIFGQGTVVSIVDAKYKRTDSGFANHDFYQVLAYGTALNCPHTYLFFPTSEYAKDGQIKVKQSPVTIDIRRVDITDDRCVQLVEEAARQVLAESHLAMVAA